MNPWKCLANRGKLSIATCMIASLASAAPIPVQSFHTDSDGVTLIVFVFSGHGVGATAEANPDAVVHYVGKAVNVLCKK